VLTDDRERAVRDRRPRKEVRDMSTISHPPTGATARSRFAVQLLVTEMWAALAIVAMWVAVAIAAVWGTEFVSSTPGGNSTTIPAAIAVAVFASIGTWAVAKYGFGRTSNDPE
jgi:hypothetical protein